MKILVSAYACEPGKGSEPGVGWNLVKELSTRVTLSVITRPNNRGPIESSGEAWVKNVQWIYWDPPYWLTFWKKGSRGVQAFYILWQLGVYTVALALVKSEGIALAHHLTFGKYWIPSRLASLPCPYIFGPVGGGEKTPPGLVGGESWRGRFAEHLKRLTSAITTRNPFSLLLYRKAAWTFAATEQTASALESLGVSRVSVLPQSGIRPDDLPVGLNDIPNDVSAKSELVLVTAARLIHWKAIDLAIEAVATASRIIPIRLVVLQTGPELENLRKLSKSLGVEKLIEFKGRLPRLEDVYQEIAQADALVHTALHEAFGQACLESLALGVPVICLNWGGPGLIVDQETGFVVKPKDRAETISRLAQAMVKLANERQSGNSRATACRARAYGVFHWQNLADAIVAKYVETIAKAKPSSR